MTPDHAKISYALAQAVVANAGGRIVEQKWTCDVRRANAGLISLHNQDRLNRGLKVEETFRGLRTEPLLLQDVLTQDFRFLSSSETALDGYIDRYLFLEVDNPRLQSQCMHISGGGSYSHIITLTGNLVRFIHAAISKTTMLLQHDRLDGCLDEHVDLVMTEAYSDVSLLLGLLNDVEIVCGSSRPCEITPAHLTRPYDYCEHVEGARRFVFGHELGHSVVDRFFKPGHVFRASNFIAGLDQFWTEEQFCDVFSVQILLNAYQRIRDEGHWTTSLAYEMLNNLAGAITFVALLDMLHISFNGGRAGATTHPPVIQRLELIHTAAMTHPLFLEMPELLMRLNAGWWHVRELRRMVGVTFASDSDMAEFHRTGRLTSFGYQAYLAIKAHGPTGQSLIFD